MVFMRKLVLTALLITACSNGDSSSRKASAGDVATVDSTSRVETPVTLDTPVAVSAEGDTLPPNELGRIPILEYHLIGDSSARWMRERGQFRKDLELLYARGFRPVTMAEVLDKKLDLPRGQSPVVVVFDDASPSQFKYIEQNGNLEIDPNSAVGIWL